MADIKNTTEKEAPEEAIVYQGNKIPKMLRWIYLAFAVWGTVYGIKYLLPNLLLWLKPH